MYLYEWFDQIAFNGKTVAYSFLQVYIGKVLRYIYLLVRYANFKQPATITYYTNTDVWFLFVIQ